MVHIASGDDMTRKFANETDLLPDKLTTFACGLAAGIEFSARHFGAAIAFAGFGIGYFGLALSYGGYWS
jgi:hypothetical protein